MRIWPSARRASTSVLLSAASALLLGALTTPALAQDAPAPAASCDPYRDYSCLDAYLGDDVGTRILRYYALEWGQSGPPANPSAPPSRRADWPATPQSTPPM